MSGNQKRSSYQELIDEEFEEDMTWPNYLLLLEAVFKIDSSPNKENLRKVKEQFGSRSREYRRAYYHLKKNEDGIREKRDRTSPALSSYRRTSEDFRWRSHGPGERSVS